MRLASHLPPSSFHSLATVSVSTARPVRRSLRSLHRLIDLHSFILSLLARADKPHLSTLSSSAHFQPKALQDLSSTQLVTFGSFLG